MTVVRSDRALHASGTPDGGDPEPEVTPHFGSLARGDEHVPGKLFRGEAAEYRDEPVVPRHRMKAEWPRYEPESTCREPTAPEIADYDPPSGDTVELP